ncbi:MAG: hypothetical protein HYZ45_07770, partial [Burkholderiales bacterium]|nr:hypothetical protein [Burkholderiales bacterium]
MITQLFQIDLHHSYFVSGMFDSCQLVPDTNTANFIERYQLLQRSSNGGLGLYSTSLNSSEHFVAYLNQKLAGQPLQFLLLNDENKFAQITDLPFTYVGQIAVSTINAEVSADAGNVVQLQPVQGPRLLNQANVIGVVSIYLSDWLRLSNGGACVCFSVQFQARVLHWLYYLINRSQTRLHQPAICNRQKEFFQGPMPVTLANGEKALSFYSGNLQFPLQQVPDTIFDLIDYLQPSLHTSEKNSAPAIEHCLIKGLPTPSGENLKSK